MEQGLPNYIQLELRKGDWIWVLDIFSELDWDVNFSSRGRHMNTYEYLIVKPKQKSIVFNLLKTEKKSIPIPEDLRSIFALLGRNTEAKLNFVLGLAK